MASELLKTNRTFNLEILPQPDNQTCGPTCLQAIYACYGHRISLEEVIEGIEQFEGGGTVAVTLGNDALRRGFRASIFTYNIQVFDPTWFRSSKTDLSEKLRLQSQHRSGRKIRRIISEYLRFIEGGGTIRFENLTPSLLARMLAAGTPLLTGLSATYLYNCAREFDGDYDDVKGEPTGHFVILCEYLKDQRRVRVADPLHPNPLCSSPFYDVEVDRVIPAILLGTLTYDANLLIISPSESK